jgi:DNA-binding response OmpR family regulator
MFLVDDEADIVDILSRGLELKGMLVDAYSSPLQAPQAFKQTYIT